MERGRIQGLPKFFEYPLLSHKRIKLRTSNLALGRYIRGVHPNKSPLKFWKKMERGRIQGLPKFFEYPLLSHKLIKLRTSNLALGRYIHGVHPNKSPLKFWEKMERGCIQGLPEFFWVPPIISGTGKATNFNFCTHILSIDRNKSRLQISGKVAGCVVRTLKTFQCTHILGASRGLLCDRSAVLSVTVLNAP